MLGGLLYPVRANRWLHQQHAFVLVMKAGSGRALNSREQNTTGDLWTNAHRLQSERPIGFGDSVDFIGRPIPQHNRETV